MASAAEEEEDLMGISSLFWTKGDPNSAFTCTICYRTLTTMKGLKRHTKEVHHEGPFTCVLCDKRYARKTGIREHMKAAHDAADLSICMICNLSFTKSRGLEDHMMADHKIKTAENDEFIVVEFEDNDNDD